MNMNDGFSSIGRDFDLRSHMSDSQFSVGYYQPKEMRMENVNFVRSAHFKLGHEPTSYLTQAKLQQLGDQGQA